MIHFLLMYWLNEDVLKSSGPCCCCLPTPLTLVCGWGGVRSYRFWSTTQLIPPSGQQLHHSSGICQQIGYRGGIVVMDVIWRRLCVSMIWGRKLGNGATSDAGKYLFRAANAWWRCALYFVIASCG